MCLYILNDDYKSLPDPMYGYKLVRNHFDTNKLMPLYAFDDSIINFFKGQPPKKVDELPRKRWKTHQANGSFLFGDGETCGTKQYGLATSYARNYPLGFHSFVDLQAIDHYSRQIFNPYDSFGVLVVKVKLKGLIASGYLGALERDLCVISKEQKIEEILYPLKV